MMDAKDRPRAPAPLQPTTPRPTQVIGMRPEIQKELLDRTRRIETRVTKFMEHMGFDSGIQRPKFEDTPEGPQVTITSRGAALNTILAAIPPARVDEDVAVFLEGEVVCYVALPPLVA